MKRVLADPTLTASGQPTTFGHILLGVSLALAAVLAAAWVVWRLDKAANWLAARRAERLDAKRRHPAGRSLDDRSATAAVVADWRAATRSEMDELTVADVREIFAAMVDELPRPTHEQVRRWAGLNRKGGA